MKKRKIEICSICGEKKECTRDHIPPKSIFLSPKPSNLVTVPACSDYNHGSSIYDERFKTYLALHVAMYSEKGAKFFKEALRTLNHNKKLKEKIINSIEPVGFQNQTEFL